MLEYIPSYYMLQYLGMNDWSKRDSALAEHARLAQHMALCFRDYLFMASMGEARHGASRIGLGFDGFQDRGRSSIFKSCLVYAPCPENFKSLTSLFRDYNWGGSFGGEKWASIVDMVAQYGTMSDLLYTDMIVNARHNGGLAFNKEEAALYMDIRFNILGNNTIDAFLNYKRMSPNLLEGYAKIFNQAELTAGRLAFAYMIERHMNNTLLALRAIPDGVYKPVNWGDQLLPGTVKKKKVVRCGYCSEDISDNVKHCVSCGGYICSDHAHKNSQSDTFYYCEVCYEKLSNVRCPVCMGWIKGSEVESGSCGDKIHKQCMPLHRQQCLECNDDFPSIELDPELTLCSHCHKPLVSIGEAVPYEGKPYHNYCLGHKLKKAGPAGWKLYQSIAEPCAICGDNVLKSSKTAVDVYCEHINGKKAHHLCYKYHRATEHLHDDSECHCEDCLADMERYKELYEQHHAPSDTKVEVETKVQESEKEQSNDAKLFTPVTDGKYAQLLDDYIQGKASLP